MNPEEKPKADGRRATSPENGRRGGRSAIDWGEIAMEYAKTRISHWRREGFYIYDERIGAYRLFSEREMGAQVGAFLCDGGAQAWNVGYSLNAERNLLGGIRATNDLSLVPPVFLSTGKSAAGWIAMRNCLFDVEGYARGRSDTIREHTPDFFSTRALPYDWTSDAQCPRWEKFMEEAQPDDEGYSMCQLLAGLLLVPDTTYNVFFILLGEGGCGKSVFLNVLSAMLTDANVCCVTLDEMREKHTGHRLTQALANLVDDSATADGSKFGLTMAGVEGLLKRVASGAKIHCEPKGVDPWEASATARCVFCLNGQLPQFTDRTNAIWDRMRVIPFRQRFRGTEGQNPRLAQEIIEEELPGVFAWAVDGLAALRESHRRQFPQSRDGAAIIDEHRSTCDREKLFLQERYEVRNGAFTPSGDIYSAYKSWCSAEGYQPKNNGNFKAEVVRVFPQALPVNINVDGTRTRGYRNLATLAVVETEI